MSHDRSLVAKLKCFKLAAGAAAVLAVGYYVYKQYYSTPAAASTDEKADASQTTTEEPAKTKRINLSQADREDVIQLLREVSDVQKELARLMEKVMGEVVEKDLDIVETYKLLRASEPADPLDAHGLTIAGFDSLLERFSADKEVHQMIIEVIQGPSPSSLPSGRPAQDLTPDMLVQINAAMRDKLRETAEELMARQAEFGGPYEPRTASLTAQSMVGAFVQKQFGVTPEEVERSMSVYTYQLSSREDFAAINEDIQSIMTKLQIAPAGTAAAANQTGEGRPTNNA